METLIGPSMPERVAEGAPDNSLIVIEIQCLITLVIQQHSYRVSQPLHPPSLDPDNRGGAVDGEEQHDVRELPPDSAARCGLRHTDNIACGLHRRLFPRWALWVYLVIMLFLIGALMALTIFGFIVTGAGGGVVVPGRMYREYHLDNYSPWLRKRIEDPHYWLTVKSCILGSKACSKVVLWTPFDYLTKDMTPIQSGCCKPPTSCNYAAATLAQEADCYRWNNAPPVLCYDCDSCKAGVLEDVRRDWHKLSVLNIVMVIVLIGIYSIGCCAFQNAKRAETDYPYGHNRMYKVRPRWDFHW
ncbi:UNVERIFIED_CONTAM: Tetraspanin-5 [Sesamum calycinum]|uniref:Tetraspanin-5 n=1 Tax=Sesamum calycinum TaxID=2727403 RepID=A0AAW2J673_9LAMI